MPLDDLSDLPDEALLLRYAQGDRMAARALVLRLSPRLLSYVSRVLQDRSEAEDVVQEALLRLWRIAPDWRPGEAQVTTWLYRVATNLVTDRQRARQRRRTGALDEAPEPTDGQRGPLARLIEADRMAALDAALACLPERQRQAVVLRHLEGLTNPEIATILEIGVEAVESLTARGKRALAAALSGQRAELGYEDEEALP